MNNRINNTVEKYNMLSQGDRVLAAVSGGADSMLLLSYLLSVRKRYGITVEAAHIEHGIRGEESVADAEFVEEFCRENGVNFHLLSIDAVNEARRLKTGVEEYSRNRRYEFFNSIPCDKIATAHNRTDNAETVLFRLTRGTGLKGACGIPAVRGKIIRPLIEIGSAEIRSYCGENGIEYRVDSTNSDSSYSRNYIRNTVVPKLERLNPEFEEALTAFISDVNEDYDFIEKTADNAYGSICCEGRLCLSDLRKYDNAVIKRVIIRYFSERNIQLDRIHLCSILELIRRTGKIQLSGDYYAVSDKEYLRFADFGGDKNDCLFVSKILKISEFDKKGVDFYCDCDKIIGTVKIRGRIEGDTVRPAGRGCTKTLKKLFNEMKIPQELRNSAIIVADSVGVIGVIGCCVDERVRVTPDTKNIFSLFKLPSED